MLISLSDYFKPLLPYNIFTFILLFFFFDIFGSFIRKKLLEDVKSFRLANWLIGFGAFVFIWFIASLFVAYKQPAIIASLVLLTTIALPNYINKKEFSRLMRALWGAKIPILIILPFLPAIFVKASLPPYYGDEAAYHFIPPSSLLFLDKIRYTGGLYADSPRLMNMFWDIIFSLTKTYSIARLFHFTILATSMIVAYKILKTNFTTMTGTLFVFVFFSLPQAIALTSTIGYVDVAAYSFLLLGLLFSVDYILRRESYSVELSVIFWAMSLGTKYTGLTSFISFLVALIILIIIERKRFAKQLTKKFIIKLLILGILFGGYWYVKNLITFGNPIFPFLLPCFEKFAKLCNTGGGFFGDWTTKITLQNLFPLTAELFPENQFLQAFILSTPLIWLTAASKKARKIGFILIVPVILEVLILNKFSGFLARYQQHIQLYLLAALAILLTNKIVIKERLAKGIIFIVVLTSLYSYARVIRNTNSFRFLNGYEYNYALGRINIYDWINWRFPKMKYTIYWCENPPGGHFADLARFDPDLIWFDPTGQMRMFTTNCTFKNPPLDGIEIDEVIPKAIEGKMQFYITSPYKCRTDKDVVKKYDYEQDRMFYLRKLNNKIICNAKEIKPNLYYFDYTNLSHE